MDLIAENPFTLFLFELVHNCLSYSLLQGRSVGAGAVGVCKGLGTGGFDWGGWLRLAEDC